MKKRFPAFLCALTVVISYTVDIVNSHWSIANQIENDVVSQTTEAVCYIAETGVKYTSIEKAVSSATQNQNIYVIPGLTDASGNLLNIQISKSITLNNNINLILPYAGTEYDIGDNFSNSKSFADSNSGNVKTYRKTLVSLTNKADITIEEGSTLIIGGQCGTKGVNGSYSELNLGEESHILVKGSLKCYGFIKESNIPTENVHGNDNVGDAGRYIEISNTGSILCSLSIYDMKSGSSLQGLNSAHVCPISIFDLSNLQTYVKCNYGGEIIGVGRARIDTIVNVEINEEIPVVSSNESNKSVFYMTGEGYVSFEYSPSNISFTNDTNVTSIYLNAPIKLGYLLLSASGIEIDTRNMFLPISYKFSINLNNSFNTNGYDMKFMPGSKLKIGKEGQLLVNSSVVFYESTSLDNIYSYQGVDYPKGKGDSILINNGSIIISDSGALGANVLTENFDGTAKVDTINANKSQLSVESPESTSSIMIPVVNLTGTFVKKGDPTNTVNGMFEPNTTTYSSTVIDGVWEAKYISSSNLKIAKLGDGTYYSFIVYTSPTGEDSNSIELINTNTLTEYSTNIEIGTYVKIVVLDYTSISFNNGSIAYDPNTWYFVSDDINIEFVASKGYTINFSLGGSSGAGKQTFTITYGDSRDQLNQEYKSGSYSGKYVLKESMFFKIKPSLWGGNKYTATVKLTQDGVTTTIFTGTGKKWGDGSDNQIWEVNGDYSFTISNWSACVAPDTKVLMADGTSRLAKDLQVGDLIQTWNFEKGFLEIQPIIYSSLIKIYNGTQITLYFDDNTSTTLINQQSYFDLSIMDYSLVSKETIESLVGHRFYSVGGGSKKLVSYKINYGDFEAAGILSAYNLNFVADTLLSAEGLIVEHTFFDIDENMKYDKNKMKDDIEQYGLYEYFEFSNLITQEQFELLSGKYYKVYVGKGYCTYEFLIYMIKHFVENPDYI